MRHVLEEVSGGLLIVIGTFLFLFATWIGVTFLAGLFRDADASVSRDEWAIVQSAEARYRDTRLAGPTVIRDAGERGGQARTLLGVPARDGSGNVWILLDPKPASRPAVLPDKDFALTPAQYARLEKLAVSEEVRRFLKERVVRQPDGGDPSLLHPAF